MSGDEYRRRYGRTAAATTKKGPVGFAGSQPGPWTVKKWLFPGVGLCLAVVALLPKIHGTRRQLEWSVPACGFDAEPWGRGRYPVVDMLIAVGVPKLAQLAIKTRVLCHNCLSRKELRIISSRWLRLGCGVELLVSFSNR